MVEITTGRVIELALEIPGQGRALHKKRFYVEKYLGGGATSDVWLVSQLDRNGNIQEHAKMALKVLHPDEEDRWEKQFRDEYQVIYELWMEEARLGDGVHVIPELYGISAPKEKPVFLLMEYVPFESVENYVQSQRDSEVIAQTKELSNQVIEMMNFIFNALNLEHVGVPELEESLLKTLGRVKAEWDKTYQNRYLDDKDLSFVGQSVSRAMELLHRNGRAYKDFQAINVRYDKEQRQVKIIDWNVVTEKGSVDLTRPTGRNLIERDLYRVASLLFWLRTGVLPPKEGASPKALERIGGTAWREGTQLPLRMVLEKALSPDMNQRYSRAYFWEERRFSKEKSFLELTSLGVALERVNEWYSLGIGTLAGEVENLIKRKLWQDAWAVLDVAYARLAELPEDVQEHFRRRLGEFQTRILTGLEEHTTQRSVYEIGLRTLRSGNIQRAIGEFERALQEVPDDLRAYRWYWIAKSMYDVGLGLNEQESLWKDNLLPRLMDALDEERWDEAQRALETLQHRAPDMDFSMVETEMEVGRVLIQMQRKWPLVEYGIRNGDVENNIIAEFSESARIVNESIYRPPALLPFWQRYWEIWLKSRWPEWQRWSSVVSQLSALKRDWEEKSEKLRNWDGMNLVAYLNVTEEAVKQYPVSRQLVAIVNNTCRNLSWQGKPEEVLSICSILLRESKAGPILEKTRQLYDIAREWMYFKQVWKRRAWPDVYESLRRLKELSVALEDVDIGRALYVSLFQKDEQMCEESEAWECLQERLQKMEIKERKEFIQKITQETFNMNVSELEERLGLLRSYQEAVRGKDYLSDVEADVKNAILKVENLKRKAQVQNRLENAQECERLGDTYRDKFEFEKARQQYEEAINLTDGLNDGWVKELKRRISLKKIQVEQASRDLESIKTNLNVIKQKREQLRQQLECLRKAGLLEKNKPFVSQMLSGISRIVASLKPYEFLGLVKKELEETRGLAIEHGLSQRFWAKVYEAQVEADIELLQSDIDWGNELKVEEFKKALERVEALLGEESINKERYLGSLKDALKLEIERLWNTGSTDLENMLIRVWRAMNLLKVYWRLSPHAPETRPETSVVPLFSNASEVFDYLVKWSGQESVLAAQLLAQLMLRPASYSRMLPEYQLDQLSAWLSEGHRLLPKWGYERLSWSFEKSVEELVKAESEEDVRRLVIRVARLNDMLGRYGARTM